MNPRTQAALRDGASILFGIVCGYIGRRFFRWFFRFAAKRNEVVMKRISVLVLTLVLSGSLCAEGASEKGAAAMKDLAQVVIEVNDKKITLGEIEQRLSAMASAVRLRIRANKQRFLDGLVQGELLYQEAIRQKIDESPQVRKRVERLKRRLVIEQFLRQDAEAVSVPEGQLRDFFLANKERFRRRESVTLAHIVLKTEREAWDAVAELRKGTPFAQVARERSVFEGTRDSGGMMGTAERGALDKALEDVAFKLPIGQPSDPIRTSVGWQVIRVLERIGAADAKYEDVKDDVKLVYSELKRNERYEALLRRLREGAKVKVYTERFK